MSLRLVLRTCLLVCALPAVAQEAPHYTYEGEHGPDSWGHLSHAWEICGIGSYQSPVDIPSEAAVDTATLTLTAQYTPTAAAVRNLGHTIQVEPTDDAGSVVANGITYAFRQVHFHHRSEHRVDGQDAAMEAHFVHQSPEGNYLVFGILMQEAGAEEASGSLAKFFGYAMQLAPAEEGESQPIGTLPTLGDWIAEGTGFYTYEGSLTTPPCSQSVTWIVEREPQYVLAADIETFARLVGENARPVQPLNDRVIHSQ